MSPPQTVALCVTCLVDQLMPDVGVATVRLLRRAGFTVAFPEAQTCCGQPFFNSGFESQARDLARRAIEIFEPYDAVVLPSGSCTGMMRLEYPHLMAAQSGWHVRAQLLAAKTYELTEFLTRFAPDLVTANPHSKALTYHDSCHMCRLLGVRDEPRQLLNAAGHTVTEMAESDRCCGFGGLFSLRMPEVSNAMTAEKLRQAADTDAAALVTADPGCLMQLRGLAPADLPVEHIATVLEEATR
jgi:L-lactate dehydrogenase complex protein LldE